MKKFTVHCFKATPTVKLLVLQLCGWNKVCECDDTVGHNITALTVYVVIFFNISVTRYSCCCDWRGANSWSQAPTCDGVEQLQQQLLPERKESSAGWKGDSHKYVDHTGAVMKALCLLILTFPSTTLWSRQRDGEQVTCIQMNEPN